MYQMLIFVQQYQMIKESASTIEHLMAAFYIAGIDNVIVELNSQEVPIMDGSAKDYIEKISAVGLQSTNVPIKIIKIDKKWKF